MPTNTDRADAAYAAVRRYESRQFPDTEEEPETVISDLLGDLLHHTTEQGLDWRDVVRRGINHFRAELVDEHGLGPELDGVVTPTLQHLPEELQPSTDHDVQLLLATLDVAPLVRELTIDR